MGFVRAYIKSMRPYTFFITGIAGLLGMLLVQSSVSLLQKIVVFLILFSSYGVNQVINDLIGIKEDKINAPNRPSVSGEMDKKKAVILTVFIFLIGAVLTYLFNPYALIIYFLGYFANIIYEYMKGIPLIGNFWFGAMISLTTIYGALAITNLNIIDIFMNVNLMCVTLLVVLSSSTLCYFTYFKDYKGDKKTDKKTIVVLLYPKYLKYLNFLMSLLPFIVLACVFYFKLWNLQLNYYFFILIFITFILSQYVSFLHSKDKINYKKSLELNFESTVLFQSSLIALINPLLSAILFIFSFFSIKIIFNVMYRKGLY